MDLAHQQSQAAERLTCFDAMAWRPTTSLRLRPRWPECRDGALVQESPSDLEGAGSNPDSALGQSHTLSLAHTQGCWEDRGRGGASDAPLSCLGGIKM